MNLLDTSVVKLCLLINRTSFRRSSLVFERIEERARNAFFGRCNVTIYINTIYITYILVRWSLRDGTWQRIAPFSVAWTHCDNNKTVCNALSSAGLCGSRCAILPRCCAPFSYCKTWNSSFTWISFPKPPWFYDKNSRIHYSLLLLLPGLSVSVFKNLQAEALDTYSKESHPFMSYFETKWVDRVNFLI